MHAVVVELADTSDLKSDERKLVRVQVPPAAGVFLSKPSLLQLKAVVLQAGECA